MLGYMYVSFFGGQQEPSMSEPRFWLVFFSAALALNLWPGPDLLLVLSSSLSGGRRGGVASVYGAGGGGVECASWRLGRVRRCVATVA
ncbi:hypothetical protein [Stutzerimonas stutzeri]|uniref:hypothetical protein n=1 Tax=Stutzerimonas stutzeri TaxID=316 RepID=UPI003C6FA19C